MQTQTTQQHEPNPWLGLLGVLVVVGFAGLAVFDTSLRTTPAQAVASPAADVATEVASAPAAEVETTALGTADHPIPLYASEAGAHGPTQAPPASPPSAPGADATSLFDSH